MSVICVSNRKGGVGKTTISVHMAAGLAAIGYNVGLIDTDSQGHSGLMLGLPEMDGLFAALIDKRPLADCVVAVPPGAYSTLDHPSKGNLYVLPSADRTYRIPHMLRSDETFLFFDTVEQMVNDYALDVVVIDTSPTVSMFDGAIYLAADKFLYVTECERLALDGVVTAVDQMQRFVAQRKKHLQRDSAILGILPNKLRNTIVHQANIEKIQRKFGELAWPAVKMRTLWTESSNLGQTVFTYAPTGQEAADAWRIVTKVQENLWPETAATT